MDIPFNATTMKGINITATTSTVTGFGQLPTQHNTSYKLNLTRIYTHCHL